MEKMVFKNEILNIVFGSLLIIFAFVGYFTKIVEDYSLTIKECKRSF